MERHDHGRDALRVIQFLLAVLSLIAFWCSTSSNRQAQRLGPLVGLPAQAFWIQSVDWSAQWGALVVCIVYTGRYIQLAWLAWIAPRLR